jgi:hypothetical protein
MKRFFAKFKTTKATTTTTTPDPIVCRIKVYNKAIFAPVADVTFRQSERHLVGAFKFSYPSGQYRLEVTHY